jgi:hypothetical protein
MYSGELRRTSLPKLWILGSFFLILSFPSLASQIDDDTAKAKDYQQEDPQKANLVLSLAESIRKSNVRFQGERGERSQLTRDYWSKAFEEIKDLSLDFTKPNKTLNQWKFLDSQQGEPRRFDGFRSWDRLLQEWAEDISEYINKTQVEGGDYPMSNYGIPSKKKEEDQAEEEIERSYPSEILVTMNGTVALTSSGKKLPTPTPAKPGEPLVPETDISDKSKRIWIVTTAALPWMTGTAVNPLLRAAYLTKGRPPGSVTLMLPWLELPTDQVYVYGKDRVFATQEDQAEYVKTWLRETAGMKEASEKLNIAWYTAQQSRNENSIYSMGDITAFIPAEAADIVILEEPEHLNWYRVSTCKICNESAQILCQTLNATLSPITF